jgi:GNAT superfamily N-acetyltransferase
VVLCGAGLYVNQAMAVGLDAPMSSSEVELLEARSAVVGVPPSIEVTPATRPDVREEFEARGYVEDVAVSALRCHLSDPASTWTDPSLVIEPAAGQVAVWQETAAIAWGHLDPAARRASDAFGAAAAVVDGDGLLLARDAVDGRPVGCASLTIRDDIATLGGMSTIPWRRGRGVQAALIHHRVRLARAAGCVLATATAAPGGASERNLMRHGFVPWFTVTTLTGRATTAAR